MLGNIPRPSYAGVTATLALFIALGGGAYAATSLPANSVGAKQLKKSAVERAKIKNNAIDASKVLDASLTGSDIREGTLGKVPSAAAADAAANATNAANATHAASAAALDKVVYKSTTASAPADSASTGATATCDAGQRVIGVGVKLADPAAGLVDDTYPDAGNTAWTAHVANGPGEARNFTVYAICTAATAVG